MKHALLGLCLLLGACSSLKLTVVNATDKPIQKVEIKLGGKSTVLPGLAAGASNTQNLKLDKATPVNVNYVNESGQQFFTSSPIDLKPGDGGALRLSVTARGTLEAVRVP